MAEENTKLTGTLLISAISPYNSTDKYPTHYAKYGHGGYRTVQTVDEMKSIPEDRCEVGMLVYVINENKVYVYGVLDIESDLLGWKESDLWVSPEAYETNIASLSGEIANNASDIGELRNLINEFQDQNNTINGEVAEKIADQEGRLQEGFTEVRDELNSLQDQIDGKVKSWFLKGTPTNENEPVSDWSEEEYERHLGDTYTDISEVILLPSSIWEQGLYAVNNGLKYESDTSIRTIDFVENKGGILYVPDGYRVSILYYDSNNELQQYIQSDKNIQLDISYPRFKLNFSTYPTGGEVFPSLADKLKLCINPTAGQSWRWCNIDDEYGTGWHWRKMADNDAVKALAEVAETQYLKTALTEDTTDIPGGLVLTNVLALKDINGEVTAGLSGLTSIIGDPQEPVDDILLWGGGTYQQAYTAANNNYEIDDTGTQITTLIKKDGTGKIGVFEINKDSAIIQGNDSAYLDLNLDGVSITFTKNGSDLNNKIETCLNIGDPSGSDVNSISLNYSEKNSNEGITISNYQITIGNQGIQIFNSNNIGFTLDSKGIKLDIPDASKAESGYLCKSASGIIGIKG